MPIGEPAKYMLVLRMTKVMAAVISSTKDNKPDAFVVRNGASYYHQPVLCWARENDLKTIFLENGYLPKTIQVDPKGVNCNGSVPRTAHFYKSLDSSTENSYYRPLVPRKRKFGNKQKDIEIPVNYIFIPFQVPTDTQVLINSDWIQSMECFYDVLQQCVNSLPVGFYFVIKEHPSSKIRFEYLHEMNEKILFANNMSTEELIKGARTVVTLNSTVGIESLMLDVPVITLGDAAYNITGLVQQASNVTELQNLIKSVDRNKVNRWLTKKFISWLDDTYLVNGSLRNIDREVQTMKLVADRIDRILS